MGSGPFIAIAAVPGLFLQSGHSEGPLANRLVSFHPNGYSSIESKSHSTKQLI